MKFAINLKPNPAASYFTVEDHQRAFKNLGQSQKEGVMEGIISMLRKLHGIPADFKESTHHMSEMEDIRAKFEILITKDNPATGTNDLPGERPKIADGSLLDLSYSFPLTVENPGAFDVVMINPRISLGIPVEMVFLFTNKGNDGFSSSGLLPYELYLLHNVMHDLDKKGMEMIVRETNYKAAVLYQLIDACPHLAPIADKKIRSKTMIGAICSKAFAGKITKMGYDIDISDYGDTTKIFIANYTTHSKEMMELFSDRAMAL